MKTLLIITAALLLTQVKQGPKPNEPAPIPTPNPSLVQGPRPNGPCRACVADTGHHPGGPFDQLNYGYSYN